MPLATRGDSVQDVYVIADNWKSNPITSWTVRAHPSKQALGTIQFDSGRYLLKTVMGETSAHDGLHEARNFTAVLFSGAGQAN